MNPRDPSPLLRLSRNWAISADEKQWIVLKRVGSGIRSRWKPLAYVATGKSSLLRVLRDKAAIVDSEGLKVLAALPSDFRTWRDAQEP